MLFCDQGELVNKGNDKEVDNNNNGRIDLLECELWLPASVAFLQNHALFVGIQQHVFCLSPWAWEQPWDIISSTWDLPISCWSCSCGIPTIRSLLLHQTSHRAVTNRGLWFDHAHTCKLLFGRRGEKNQRTILRGYARFTKLLRTFLEETRMFVGKIS